VDGSPARFIHARDSSFSTTEEWRVAIRDYSASLSGSLFIAASLQYPITRVYRRSARSTDFGTEPHSWVQATRPEPSTQVMQRLPGWLRSFTFIAGLEALDDEWLLVQHARFLESPDNSLATLFDWRPYAFDVYTLDGERILEDVVLPGRILAADSLAYILVEAPPQPWVVAVMAPRFSRPS
jgi:hypothetical protein